MILLPCIAKRAAAVKSCGPDNAGIIARVRIIAAPTADCGDMRSFGGLLLTEQLVLSWWL
jgi:hypothetical protein